MVQAALAGRLPHWESQAAAFTALVILLDQFPRRYNKSEPLACQLTLNYSLYRGTPRMYSGDAMCRDVVVRAIFDTSVMDEVHPVYRLFPCLALTHQEDVEMQKLCVSEWARATAYFEENDPIREYGNTFKRYVAHLACARLIRFAATLKSCKNLADFLTATTFSVASQHLRSLSTLALPLTPRKSRRRARSAESLAQCTSHCPGTKLGALQS